MATLPLSNLFCRSSAFKLGTQLHKALLDFMDIDDEVDEAVSFY